MHVFKLIVVATFLLASASAYAQDETVFTFTPENFEGEAVKPGQADVDAEKHGKTTSLIDIRSDFVPEMLESVDAL